MRLWDNGRHYSRRSRALAEVGQDDGQVIDINLAVTVEVARPPRHAGGFAKVRQHDCQVVDIDLAVPIGVAKRQWFQQKRFGVSNRVYTGADNFPGIVDA